jgi:hypothetical protein
VILQDFGVRQALGVHWGAFRLADEKRRDPADALEEALLEAGMEPGRSLPLEPVSNRSVLGPTSRLTQARSCSKMIGAVDVQGMRSPNRAYSSRLSRVALRLARLPGALVGLPANPFRRAAFAPGA